MVQVFYSRNHELNKEFKKVDSLEFKLEFEKDVYFTCKQLKFNIRTQEITILQRFSSILSISNRQRLRYMKTRQKEEC